MHDNCLNTIDFSQISPQKFEDLAQAEILNVGEKNNFEVLFLDGDKYKRELRNCMQ